MPEKSEATLGTAFCFKEATSPFEVMSKKRWPALVIAVRVPASMSAEVWQVWARAIRAENVSKPHRTQDRTKLRRSGVGVILCTFFVLKALQICVTSGKPNS